MKLYKKNIDAEQDILLAEKIEGLYNDKVIFHCYWNGALNNKHMISLKSCYYFNVFKKTNRVIYLWLENNIENKYLEEAKKYAEIKIFNLKIEEQNTFLENIEYYYKKELSFYSDLVRYILLYKYGGCWFDLDILFLRDFSPLFSKFTNEICVYQWEYQQYPNGAIFISLIPNNESLKDIMNYIIKENKGWGFQESNMSYDLPLNFLVLPCAWFDIAWIKNSTELSDKNFSKFVQASDKEYTFENFFKGAFCYHWHNLWKDPIEENSILDQLNKNIDNNLILKGGKKKYKKRRISKRKTFKKKKNN